MRKIFVGLLAVSLLLAGCTGTAEISTMPEDIVESYLDASNNDDIDTCLSLLSDDVVFYQDTPGIRMEGKAQFEAMSKEHMLWHHRDTVTSPINVDGDKVACSIKAAGDDLRIIGINYMNAMVEFRVRDGKIYSIQSTPTNEDWARLIELTSGGIGIEREIVAQGWKVKRFAENSPAYEAGVRQGDIIIAVDKVSYSQMRKGEMLLRIKGSVGSKVLLTIIREGMTGPIDIEVTRVDLNQLRY